MSFGRPAIAFDIHKSWGSRHNATTPFVPGVSKRTSLSRQPAGRTAVVATIVVWGTSLGLAGAYGLSRVIESRLFGVEAVDVTSYVAAVALFSVVAVLACWVPAAAAVRVNPVDTLRAE